MERAGQQPVEIPTFEEFIAEAQEEALSSFSPEFIEQLRKAYNEQVASLQQGGNAKFSSTELKKLEQAGLLNATRQEQLDFLFGKGGGGISFDDL